MDTLVQRAHDWHSADYTRYWVADAEARDQERAEGLALMAALIPHLPEVPIHVLSLGPDYGPVTRAILARFLRARVTLFDYSQAMLEHAGSRLAALEATTGRGCDNRSGAEGCTVRENWRPAGESGHWTTLRRPRTYRSGSRPAWLAASSSEMAVSGWFA